MARDRARGNPYAYEELLKLFFIELKGSQTLEREAIDGTALATFLHY